jgi:ABC-type glycerol-3-phosphate transport system substrate-binding protein
MRKLLATSIFLFAALLVACGTSANADDSTAVPTEIPNPNSLDDPQDALDAAHALWASQGGDDYDMTFNWQCFCVVDYVQRVDLEVRGGSVSGAAGTDSGVMLTSEQLAQFRTVPELFDFIQDAIDQDAAEIRVTYASAGYPSEVWIDYDTGVADEERGFFVHSLTVR